MSTPQAGSARSAVARIKQTSRIGIIMRVLRHHFCIARVKCCAFISERRLSAVAECALLHRMLRNMLASDLLSITKNAFVSSSSYHRRALPLAPPAHKGGGSGSAAPLLGAATRKHRLLSLVSGISSRLAHRWAMRRSHRVKTRAQGYLNSGRSFSRNMNNASLKLRGHVVSVKARKRKQAYGKKRAKKKNAQTGGAVW